MQKDQGDLSVESGDVAVNDTLLVAADFILFLIQKKLLHSLFALGELCVFQ